MNEWAGTYYRCIKRTGRVDYRCISERTDGQMGGWMGERVDDWCAAVTEQTIFSPRPKSAVIEIGPDHARGWG